MLWCSGLTSRASAVAGWTKETLQKGATLVLNSAEDKRAQLLPALATLLEQRYKAASDKTGAQRARIALMQKEAVNSAP